MTWAVINSIRNPARGALVELVGSGDGRRGRQIPHWRLQVHQAHLHGWRVALICNLICISQFVGGKWGGDTEGVREELEMLQEEAQLILSQWGLSRQLYGNNQWEAELCLAWGLGRMFFIPDWPPSGSSPGCQVKLLPPEQALHGPALLCAGRISSLQESHRLSITKMGQDPPDSSTSEPAPWFLTAPSAKLLFAENHYCPSLLNLPEMMFNWGTN